MSANKDPVGGVNDNEKRAEGGRRRRRSKVLRVLSLLLPRAPRFGQSASGARSCNDLPLLLCLSFFLDSSSFNLLPPGPPLATLHLIAWVTSILYWTRS